MEVEAVFQLLSQENAGEQWLGQLAVVDPQKAQRNLVGISKSGVSLDLMSVVCEQLSESLPAVSDPDRALNNLERFFQAARSPLALAALFERDEEALPSLLQLFAASQHLSDLLVREPEAYDLLRITEGQPVSRAKLVDDICTEVASHQDEAAVMAALRQFKQREMLRIAYGDIIRDQPVAVVTRQISNLADAICEAALQFANRSLIAKRGQPLRRDGSPAQIFVLGMGKLGGVELNYSSDIDLILLYDEDGRTTGERSITNQEFFERVAKLFVKLLTETTELGTVYRVDLRLRPDGSRGPLVTTIGRALHYYDTSGRTWERQAMIKARPVAGSHELGETFLHKLEPWLHARYLSRADISGIQALKRRIENRTTSKGVSERNVKTGRGGIRDIEFSIQFLQLLNGGDADETHTTNTLEAIQRLATVGALTHQEHMLLEDNYGFLRKLEHRLQIMFDMQTHELPKDEKELGRIAQRMGFVSDDEKTPLEYFQISLRQRTDVNRKILDHLLHNAFGDDSPAEPEVDLVLDPDPSEAFIHEVLGKYGFNDIAGAYRNLMELASEKIPFLSTRRCRHFLAAIAPRLLAEIAKTPSPDSTLVRISQVSDSVGGKGVLWEMFSEIPPTLHLYVTICAATPYLSGILVSNPGMIDELMDSLVINQLPSLESLNHTLSELCRGAEDIQPILHNFKYSNHLRVGVRDLLRKDGVERTHQALANIAEVCFQEVATREYETLVQKYGKPIIEGENRPCEIVVIALGKLGGREPNYHSDLDVIFLYEAEGRTDHRNPDRGTTNQHFFTQLGQRIIKQFNELGPYGRLFEIDARLRPTGKSGPLAVSYAGFERYFAAGRGELWERQALCKARPIFGEAKASEAAMASVTKIITSPIWKPEHAAQIYKMRLQMEATAKHYNLKRAPGGTVDIEFAVQLLQLKHAAAHPEVLRPGTFQAIAALAEVGAISLGRAEQLGDGYRLLREVEARLRLLNTSARHDLPTDPMEQKKLAYLLGYENVEQLAHETDLCRRQNRKLFEQIVREAAN